MTTRADYHVDTASQFLAKARIYLAEEDLLQASEKGWGAAARMVKAVAETRGWPHHGHYELWRVIDRLVDETGDEELRTIFKLASGLHINFYEGWLAREAIEQDLPQIDDLVERLQAQL